MYNEVAQGVRTNLSLQQIVNLAWMVQQIPADHIRLVVIGPNQVTFNTSAEGMSILLPIPDALRDLVYETFSTTPEPTGEPETAAVTPTPAVAMSALERMQAEQARVALYNGTFVAGLAASTNDILLAQGLEVALVDNASQVYELTTLIDYTGNPNTIQFIADLCSRVFVLDYGQKLAEGMPEQIMADEAVIEAYFGADGGDYEDE